MLEYGGTGVLKVLIRFADTPGLAQAFRQLSAANPLARVHLRTAALQVRVTGMWLLVAGPLVLPPESSTRQ